MKSYYTSLCSLMIFIIFNSHQLFSQSELSQQFIDAYKKDGWVYFGNNIFLYKERENITGNPQVLSLSIDPIESTAMLFLNEYDCDNSRVMMIAYKRYQNRPYIEKEHYLFESRREWDYPLKTSIADAMLQAVCKKFGN